MDVLPKVSIVIACYNDPNVGKAIESASTQTYINKEIIVVDDGSNEETKHIIKEISDKIDILITQENQGQSIARNNGIKRSGGKYILNLDSDDYFEKSFCEKAVKILEEGEEIKIVTCKARRFNAKGEIDIFTPRGGSKQDFLFSNSALGSAMFRKSDWETVGGYEEKLPILGLEDWELYIQLLKEGGYAYVIPEVLFNYQIRKNSITARIKHEKSDKFREIVLKHKDIYINHYELLVNNLFDRIRIEEKKQADLVKKKDFRLGRAFLKPVRMLKSFFN